MKASTVLASLLFGSFAAAAPVDKRALVYKTEIVTETVVVYTTVYDDSTSAPTSSAASTSNAAAFYEQQKPTTSSAPAAATPNAPAAPAAPAYTPPVVEQPKPSPSPSPKPEPVPAPAPQPEQPQPEQSKPQPEPSQAPAPAPAPKPEPVNTPAPAPSSAPAPSATASAPATHQNPTAGSGVAGSSYSGVDITVYDNNGAAGACGKSLTDGMMVAAISKGLWDKMGGSTYDYMTGASSNPWCGTEIEVEYNGKSATVTIMDLCPGCLNANDIDLSRAAWKSLGITEDTRLKASWKVI